MLTVKDVLRGINRYWAPKADEGRSSLEVLAWHAAAELASFVELTMEPGDLHIIESKIVGCGNSFRGYHDAGSPHRRSSRCRGQSAVTAS